MVVVVWGAPGNMPCVALRDVRLRLLLEKLWDSLHLRVRCKLHKKTRKFEHKSKRETVCMHMSQRKHSERRGEEKVDEKKDEDKKEALESSLQPSHHFNATQNSIPVQPYLDIP